MPHFAWNLIAHANAAAVGPGLCQCKAPPPKIQVNAALHLQASNGNYAKSQVLTFMGDAPNPEGKSFDKPSSEQQARGSTSRGEAIGSGSGNGEGTATSAAPPWCPEDGFRVQGPQSSEPLRSSPVPDKRDVSEAPPFEILWERCFPRRPKAWFRIGVATPATRAALVAAVGETGGENCPDVSVKLPKPAKPALASCNAAAGVARFTSTHLPASLCDGKSMRTASDATEPCAPFAKRTKPKPRDRFVCRSTMTTASATKPYALK
mmetsp:Transcript_117632/g.228684  ORF Transcript_117632/g.228684 Transcript_117632/m.228684 type:complete len:264 (+) Transcript_117632:185-976(+)